MHQNELYLTLFVVLCLTPLATAERHNYLSLNDDHGEERDEPLPVGESRSSGGTRSNSPPPYFGVVYSYGSSASLGNFIRFGGKAVFMHQETARLLKKRTNDEIYLLNPAPLEYRPHTDIWDRKNMPKGLRLRGIKDVVEKNKNLPIINLSGFSVYKMDVDYDTDYKPPFMVNDTKEEGKECYVQTYSSNPNGSNLPFVYDFISHPLKKVYFSTFKVEPAGCDKNGHCILISKGGKICHGYADLGSPILCGPQKKLTYLTLPDKHKLDKRFGHFKCSNTVKAYHLAYPWAAPIEKLDVDD